MAERVLIMNNIVSIKKAELATARADSIAAYNIATRCRPEDYPAAAFAATIARARCEAAAAALRVAERAVDFRLISNIG